MRLSSLAWRLREALLLVLAALLLAPVAGAASAAAPFGPAPVGLKGPARGLFDRHRVPTDRDTLQVVNGGVLQLNWADLQPAPGGPLATADLDRLLRKAKRSNRRTPAHNLQVKLRVYAGVNAPEWAKNLDGPPISLVDPQGGTPIGTVGRFWTPSFGAAYDDLMGKLAARYDGNPLIVDVAVSRCTTEFAEPFLRQGASDANRAAYFAAGFSVAADQQCHTQEIDSHARWWVNTRSSLALNPYDSISPERDSTDEPFTETMMGYCRQVLGTRCVLGNNSLSWPLGRGAYPTMYERLASFGPPLYFQTATLGNVGDLRGALEWAIGHGANMVELPTGYETVVPLPELAGYDARLEANPSP